MIKKKNKLLVFCFAMIPGAGEMYLGFMKMGVSLMALFTAACFSAVLIQSPVVMFWCVPLWFYSFFHATNLRSLPDDVFYELEDDYLFHLADGQEERLFLARRYRKVIAVVLIFVGIAIIWNNWIGLISRCLPSVAADILRNIGRRLPQTAAAVGIIIMGINMIRGKRKELLELEDKNNGGYGNDEQS